MKVPTPRKVSSGKWFIQLRLGRESIPVADWDKKKCIRDAQSIKAEYLAGKRVPKEIPVKSPTFTQEIDAYLAERNNTISPLTIRGYRIIQKSRFQSIMNRRVDEIDEGEWQGIINAEAALCAPKTLDNAFSFIRSIYTMRPEKSCQRSPCLQERQTKRSFSTRSKSKYL